MVGQGFTEAKTRNCMTRLRSLLEVASSRRVFQRPLRIVLWCALPFLFWLYFQSPFARAVPIKDVLPAYGSTILQIGQASWADGLGLVSHAAVSYLWAALIIAIDLMFGLALLRWMSRKTSCHLSPALRAASALALGCGFAGMAVFGLGAGHHLTRNAVVGITGLMAVAGMGGLFKQRAWRWGFSFLAAFRPSRTNRKLIMASTFVLLPAIAIHGFDLFSGRKQQGQFDFQRDTSVYVNHYYFYVDDEEFGPAFVKVCSYAPWGLKLCLNGHEWAKRQLAKRGVGYEALDNGGFCCEDPAQLQAICEALLHGSGRKRNSPFPKP